MLFRTMFMAMGVAGICVRHIVRMGMIVGMRVSIAMMMDVIVRVVRVPMGAGLR